MTSFPAQKIGLQDRGILRAGAWADLVVFDPDTIIDVAGYQGEDWRPEGIQTVIVNGDIVVYNQRVTGKTPGKVLRHASSVA